MLCVDEKPSIQALERAQGYLKLPNGRALTGQSHDYKRHGTTTLFAALEVATGKIIATHSKRRRRVEFLDFMDQRHRSFSGPPASRHPRQSQHPQEERGMARSTSQCAIPLHADQRVLAQSGRGLVLDLAGPIAQRRLIHSLKQLQEHIDAYINAYNDKAEPFVWTKKKVRQRRFKGRRITQL